MWLAKVTRSSFEKTFESTCDLRSYRTFTTEIHKLQFLSEPTSRKHKHGARTIARSLVYCEGISLFHVEPADEMLGSVEQKESKRKVQRFNGSTDIQHL